MSQVHQLYRLQQLDTEIAQRKSRLMDVLRAQKANEAVLSARREAASAEETLRKWQGRQKALELELSTVNEKAGRSEERLYSGKVKNTKELEDLQHETEALARRRVVLEDQILETMLMIEDADVVNARAAADLARLEESWNARLQSLRVEQNELATRINELIAARKEQVARIEPGFLDEYLAAAKHGGGIAVSALDQGRCQACGVTTSAMKKRAVEQGELVYCGSCGRILSAG